MMHRNMTFYEQNKSAFKNVAERDTNTLNVLLLPPQPLVNACVYAGKYDKCAK